MSVEEDIASELFERGVAAAIADQKVRGLGEGAQARMSRMIAASRSKKIVTHKKVDRDLVTGELIGAREISRSIFQDEVDEFYGYVHVMAHWLDNVSADGKLIGGGK